MEVVGDLCVTGMHLDIEMVAEVLQFGVTSLRKQE